MTDTPSRSNIESNEYIGILGTRARNTRIIQTDPTSGTAAEMAADAAAIILAGTEVANQGKRWENTTDGLIYDFRPVGGTWGYYLETNADAGGNIPVTVDEVNNIKYVEITFTADGTQTIPNTEGYTEVAVRCTISGGGGTPIYQLRYDVSPDQSGILTGALGMRDMQASDHNTGTATFSQIAQVERKGMKASAVQIKCTGLTTGTAVLYFTFR